MADFTRSRFRLPHWGWLLLATTMLAVAGIGLSIWMPYQREQQVIREIEGWGGRVERESIHPKWVRRLFGGEQPGVFNRVAVVHLNRSTITDAGMASLGRLTNLRVLYLDGTQVGDEGLALLHSPKLETLNLGRTQVSDVGLGQLTGSKTLKWLNLTGTEVTAKAIDDLKKALPNCGIRY